MFTEGISKLKKSFEKDYIKTKSVFIPFFNEFIHFNNYGLKHIFLDSNNEYRSIDEIIYRHLLHLESSL